MCASNDITSKTHSHRKWWIVIFINADGSDNEEQQEAEAKDERW